MNVTAIDRRPGALYELSGVSKVYGDGAFRVHALSDVDLVVGEGEFLAVAGPSGSGKTTMLQLLGGLDRPSSGRLDFQGQDLGEMGDGELTALRLRTFGFVFQQFNLIPTLTARQNVEAALAPLGQKGPVRHARSRELLAAVALGARMDHLPSQLSGGEQQRVAIARALANDPEVILADEPTGNLDSATGEEILRVLRGLSENRGQTVIVITHDASIADQAGRVVRLLDGYLVQEELPEASAQAPESG
jgi:putative ABC transport system ATP-binding protein